MGTVGSRMSRPLKNWNVENRAHKVISRPKPVPAPTYPAVSKQIELVDQMYPDYKEAANKKHHELDTHLKQVYVESNSAEVSSVDTRYDPSRPLPADKLRFEGFEFGFYEPSEAREGRITLRQSIEAISNYNKDPEKYSAEFIARQYNMPLKVVEDILDYYQLFNVHERVTVDESQQDKTAMPLTLSVKSGLTIPHTKKPKPRIEGGLERLDGRKYPPLEKPPEPEPERVDEEQKREKIAAEDRGRIAEK